MADVYSKNKRSLVMAAVRATGNKSTELSLIKLFRKCRITGWKRNYSLIGHPDFTFRERRLVVFVDGCFWHGCPKHLRKPKSNVDYWLKKISTNRMRDSRVRRELRRRGWRVLRVWEHELHNEKFVLKRLCYAFDHNSD